MKAIRSWWATHFLGAELSLAVVIALAVVAWSELLSGPDAMNRLLAENRGYVYSTFATLSGALFGFVITAMSVVLSFISSERLERVRGSAAYPSLWKVFSSAIYALGIATVVALFALVMDRDRSPMRIAFYLALGTLVLAAFRLARCVWLLEKLIAIVGGSGHPSRPA